MAVIDVLCETDANADQSGMPPSAHRHRDPGSCVALELSGS